MPTLLYDNKWLASLLVLVAAVLLRWILVRLIRKLPAADDDAHRRWANALRNSMTTLVVLGLIIIWLPELQFVALSIATFTVALIIATREFIQCYLGALYKTSSRAFSIGDWIQTGHHYGEVASSNWLTTKLLEIDLHANDYTYSGRTIVLPNNQFITQPVYNLTFMRRYVAHTSNLTRNAQNIDVCRAQELILQQAKAYCAPFGEVAQRYNSLLEKRLGVRLAGPDPSVRVSTTELGRNQFTISIFCPTHEAVNIEQRLTADFMAFWYGEQERLRTRA